MSSDDDKDTPFSLRRWSARKVEATRAARREQAVNGAPDAGNVPPVQQRGLSDAHAVATAAAAGPAAPSPPEPASPVLPPLDSLTFDSDFSVFLQPKVDESLKRAALKKLFRDPRFNVMDGLDVYIDDYSIPSPLEPELVNEMLHARFTLNPPPTRVNAAGFVEDVPPEELPAKAEGQAAEMAALPEASDPEPAPDAVPPDTSASAAPPT